MKKSNRKKHYYPYWNPWYIKVRNWFLYHFIECPACNGEGGETEVILDDGSGPYYPCGYCNEKGVVLNPYKRILWWYWTLREKK